MKKFSILILTINWLFGLNGFELVQKINSRKTPIDSKVDLIMNLTNKKGNTRKSILHSILKNNGEKQIIWFIEPADDRGVAFLKIEHKEKDDEMRIWLPAFKKIRRISAKKRSDSFMGSDLSYEDLSNRNIDDYSYKIIGNKIFINNNSCYLLESIPNENIQTEYSKHLTWIDSNLFIPLQEESYDKSEELLKKKSYNYNTINEYLVLTYIIVENVQKNHSTSLKFENIELDTNVKDDLFHERNLKYLPK